jgi:hypothetical protein
MKDAGILEGDLVVDRTAKPVNRTGGERGHAVKVGADLTCRVHHSDTASPQPVRAEASKGKEAL